MILEPKKIKSVTVSIVSPIICHKVMGPDAMILRFLFFSLFFQQEVHNFITQSQFDRHLTFVFGEVYGKGHRDSNILIIVAY